MQIYVIYSLLIYFDFFPHLRDRGNGLTYFGWLQNSVHESLAVSLFKQITYTRGILKLLFHLDHFSSLRYHHIDTFRNRSLNRRTQSYACVLVIFFSDFKCSSLWRWSAL